MAEKYVLGAFPEGYRLYEHRREANPDNPEERGAGDRSDVYLYGYPQGRKKRFRSPNDFFHHLLWLATDETADTENCQCKFCVSDEQQKAFLELLKYQEEKFGIRAEPGETRQNYKTQLAPQNKDRPAETTPNMKSVAIAVEVPKRPTPSNPPKPLSHSSAPTASLAATPAAGPIPLMPATNQEQIQDMQPSKFMFRPGEVVWYQKSDEALGLAVVTSRELFRDADRHTRRSYNVQPLSHPYNHPPIASIQDEQLLKPWLAYSPPINFHQQLRSINVSFDQIPWEGLLQGIYGEGDTEADGSIFAAKTVDASYSPFEILSQTSTETKYNGIFLGGEKMWRGEALRIKHGEGKDIMILSEIVEKVPAPNTQKEPPELFFVGDIYTYTEWKNPAKIPPRNTFLPIRVHLDLEFRNKASLARIGTCNYWKFEHPQVRLSASEIRGRWYESRSMIPILRDTATLDRAVKDGAVWDIGDSLNSHRDSEAVMAPDQRRKETRLQAFGLSIPTSTVFEDLPLARPAQGQQQQNTFSPQRQTYSAPNVQREQQSQDVEMTDYTGV